MDIGEEESGFLQQKNQNNPFGFQRNIVKLDIQDDEQEEEEEEKQQQQQQQNNSYRQRPRNKSDEDYQIQWDNKQRNNNKNYQNTNQNTQKTSSFSLIIKLFLYIIAIIVMVKIALASYKSTYNQPYKCNIENKKIIIIESQGVQGNINIDNKQDQNLQEENQTQSGNKSLIEDNNEQDIQVLSDKIYYKCDDVKQFHLFGQSCVSHCPQGFSLDLNDNICKLNTIDHKRIETEYHKESSKYKNLITQFIYPSKQIAQKSDVNLVILIHSQNHNFNIFQTHMKAIFQVSDNLDIVFLVFNIEDIEFQKPETFLEKLNHLKKKYQFSKFKKIGICGYQLGGFLSTFAALESSFQFNFSFNVSPAIKNNDIDNQSLNDCFSIPNQNIDFSAYNIQYLQQKLTSYKGQQITFIFMSDNQDKCRNSWYSEKKNIFNSKSGIDLIYMIETNNNTEKYDRDQYILQLFDDNNIPLSFIKTVPYSQTVKPSFVRKAQVVSRFNADPKVKRFWRFFKNNVAANPWVWQIYILFNAAALFGVCYYPWLFVYQSYNADRHIDVAINKQKEWARKQEELEEEE